MSPSAGFVAEGKGVDVAGPVGIFDRRFPLRAARELEEAQRQKQPDSDFHEGTSYQGFT